MAVAKRSGPDFLFLANANSQKFDDIEEHGIANLYFHDSSNQDWISVTGDVITSSNDDPRIHEVHSKGIKAWFGDAKDGVHDGGPDDPRMKLIEVQPKCMSPNRPCSDGMQKLTCMQTSRTGSTTPAPWVLRKRLALQC